MTQTNLVITIIISLIIVSGAITANRIFTKSSIQKNLLASPSPTIQNPISNIQTNTPSPLPSSTSKSSVNIKIDSPKPQSSPQNNNQSSSQWQYPNSKVILSSTNSLSLESSDSPKTITDWYKAKIENQGMNTTSFVTTNTNNNILNKLVAANGNQEVRVEIEKNADQSITKINISL